MAFIELTRNQKTLVDEIDFEIFNKFNWYYRTTSNYPGYAYRRKGKKFVALHREILGVTDPKIPIDHINGDRLDNRRSNLRIATPQLNARNGKSRKNSTSSYIGVHLKKKYKNKKWAARLKIWGKDQHIGYFNTELEAAIARAKFIIRNNLEGFRIDISENLYI